MLTGLDVVTETYEQIANQAIHVSRLLVCVRCERRDVLDEGVERTTGREEAEEDEDLQRPGVVLFLVLVCAREAASTRR